MKEDTDLTQRRGTLNNSDQVWDLENGIDRLIGKTQRKTVTNDLQTERLNSVTTFLDRNDLEPKCSHDAVDPVRVDETDKKLDEQQLSDRRDAIYDHVGVSRVSLKRLSTPRVNLEDETLLLSLRFIP